MQDVFEIFTLQLSIQMADGCFHDWKPMSSGTPQGSVLGALLFVMNMNYRDDSVGCRITKFADDTNIGWLVNSEVEHLRLQEDIDGM